jgi:hypothetical protein
MLFIVNIVFPACVAWGEPAGNLGGEICPPSSSNLKIDVSCGNIF